MTAAVRVQIVMAGLLLVALITSADAARFDCGQPHSVGSSPTVTDALVALQASVGIYNACQERDCTCDVDHSGTQRAADALMILRAAVGQAVDLDCRCVPFSAFFLVNASTPCNDLVVTVDYGTIPMRIARTQDEEPACEIAEARAKEGCVLAVDETAERLKISLSECAVWDLTRIVRCDFDVGGPVSVSESSTAQCECIDEACDSTPPVCLGDYFILCNP